MDFQVGERVWIRLPFADGQLRQGTIYDVCLERRWPYHVLPDGADEEEGGIAYRAEELAPAFLPLDQVLPTKIPQEYWNLFKAFLGLE